MMILQTKFFLSTDNLSGDDNIFSDLAGSSQELATQNVLAMDDPTVFDPLLLASTCDDHAIIDDGLFFSKLRPRDDSSTICFTKDSPEASWIPAWLKKLPKGFGGSNESPDPEPDMGTQLYGFDRPGNPDKCPNPNYRYNLCCDGNEIGNLGPLHATPEVNALVYGKVENCYESKCMPLRIEHSFIHSFEFD